MNIALLSPLPPEQSGIADYAQALMSHLLTSGVTVETPLKAVAQDELQSVMEKTDWSRYDVVHAELGGGRLQEFAALQWLMRNRPTLVLTATVHDPERLVWRPLHFPVGLEKLAKTWPLADKLLTVLLDPWTLKAERALAGHLRRVVTLTHTGGQVLRARMRIGESVNVVIPHGVMPVESRPPAPVDTLRLLYFGFIYRGKGIEDVLQALARLLEQRPELRGQLRLTLAGGAEPSMAFRSGGAYIDELVDTIGQLGLESNIDWQLNVPEQQIAELIQNHHLMVLPYRESRKLALLGQIRGTSGALAWAMACGRGVLASDTRAFAEELSYGNGQVFRQADADALALVLEQLLDAPSICLEWAAAAQLQGRKRAWPLVAEQFSGMFKEAACVSG